MVCLTDDNLREFWHDGPAHSSKLPDRQRTTNDDRIPPATNSLLTCRRWLYLLPSAQGELSHAFGGRKGRRVVSNAGHFPVCFAGRNILAGGLGKLNGQYLLRYNSMLFFGPISTSAGLSISHTKGPQR